MPFTIGPNYIFVSGFGTTAGWDKFDSFAMPSRLPIGFNFFFAVVDELFPYIEKFPTSILIFPDYQIFGV